MGSVSQQIWDSESAEILCYSSRCAIEEIPSGIVVQSYYQKCI